MSTPYNPQQNGIVEQKNRTIMEAARSMLHDQDLPMHLWEKYVRTMVYVQNRTPHRVLKNKTHEEVFSERSQNLVISEYLVVQCTYTFQKKRGQSCILQEGRAYLWDTLKARRITEYTSRIQEDFHQQGCDI